MTLIEMKQFIAANQPEGTNEGSDEIRPKGLLNRLVGIEDSLRRGANEAFVYRKYLKVKRLKEGYKL